jgi:hypothetical protein
MSRITRQLASTLRKMEKRIPRTWAQVERATLRFIRSGEWPADAAYRSMLLNELRQAVAYCDFTKLGPEPNSSTILDARTLLNSVSLLFPPQPTPPYPEPWVPFVDLVIAEYEQDHPPSQDEDQALELLRYV